MRKIDYNTMNVKTVYCSDDETYKTEMVAYMNNHNQIFINIYIPEADDGLSIVLDKRTAIRLAKDLRREISFLEA